MESKVIFRSGQDLDPADFNNMQAYAQASIDHVVGDAVTAGRAYAGFLVAITGAAKVTADPGRLYSAGSVYVRSTAIQFDFTTQLPVTGKKIVLLLVAGSEQDVDATPREFLIDEATMAAQPQTVPMRHARIASVNTTLGAEAPDPVDPVYDAGYLAVARILLAPSGVSSVAMLTGNELPSLAGLAEGIADLMDADVQQRAKIVAIDTQVAAVVGRVTGTASQEALGRALVRLADLEAKNGIPSNAANSAADYFLTAAGSDLVNASSSCRVEEGIRFPDDAAAAAPLTILNPLNTSIRSLGGIVFPAFTEAARLAVGPRQGELQASAYTYQANTIVQKTMTRTRIRYGSIYTVCTNAGWWGAITDRYIPETFEHAGENFQTLDVQWDGPLHGWVRVQQFWYDSYDEPYWDAVTTNYAVPGAQVAETFLQANDGWLTSIGLTFTRLAADGGISLSVVEVDNRGLPDLSSALSVTAVARASLAVNAETRIPVQPVFLQGGKRYAIVVITAADHWLATTQGVNFPQGTLFYVLDGAYQQGDGTRDLCFSLSYAKFASARTVVDLGAQQLAGGIAAIDILADAVVPGSCALTYEIQIAGIWYPLGQVDQSVLSAGGALPPLVPLRAVFSGTPDAQPCIKIAGSSCRISRSKLAFVHISAVRTLPGAGSAQIRVIERLEYFDAAHHTSRVKLLTGAAFATVTTPNSVVDVVATDGSIERTSIFNLGAPVTAFCIRSEGTTDAVQRPWHVGWRKDYAL